MRIECGPCVLRAWQESDVEAAAEIANDWLVARYMSDAFPHPYTRDDALSWVALASSGTVGTQAAIEVEGAVAGGIGFMSQALERQRTASIGYWLGRTFWGRGIATAALRAMTRHAFASTDTLRLEASVFQPNAASMRVLEKCRYQREGVLRCAYVKAGKVYDAVLYAAVREQADAAQ